MNTAYLSLISDPPAGFHCGAVGKRELLSGTVVLLAADCASACALLPDFRTRVEGVVLTFGMPLIARLGPLLWHVSLSREALAHGGELLALALDAVAVASAAGDQEKRAQLAEARLRSDYEVQRNDYLRVTGALQKQVALASASENKLSAILESVDACIYLKDSEGRYLFANRAVRELWQVEMEDIVGFGDEKFFDEATSASIRCQDRRVLETGETFRSEEINTLSGSGKTAVFQSTKLPLRLEDGQIYALCGISTDITERKKQEEQTRQLLAEKETILNNVLVGIVYLKNRRIVSCNRRLEELFQYEPGELIGKSSLCFYDSRETFEKVGAEAYATVAENKNFMTEMPLRHKDGSIFWGVLSGRAVDPTRPQEGSIWIFSDISERKRAEKALRQGERYQRALFDNFPFLVWLKDTDSRFLVVNKSFAKACGYASANLLVGKTDLDIWPQELAEAYRADDRTVIDSRSAKIVEEYIEVDGQWVWFETYKSPIMVDGLVRGTVGFSRDITERKQAEEKLHLAASVFTHAREGIMITNTDGTIIDVNDTFSRITGYSRDEVVGRNSRILSSGRQEQAFYAALWRDLTEKGHWYGEIWNRRKNGAVYAEMLTISAVRDAEGNTRQYVALFSDITAVKEHARQLEHLAHYDSLTMLPNRTLLADRLQQAMAQAQRRRQPLAVAYLDLDGFKAINDRHGHDAGDQLLIELASRMKQALREGDTLARLGGDEFVAVLLDLADVAASVQVLARLLEAAAEPVQVGDLMLQVSASLGVTFYPQSEDVDADLLLRQADHAMYQAKLAGKNRYHVFDTEQDNSVRGRHESLEDIRRALSAREFVLHYQPKVNMRTGEVIGAEALIRWQHPEKGLLPPAVFLPVIEDHPLAVEIGEWVIDTALTQMQHWREAGLDIPVSVNVGARQLQQPDFVERLCALLAAHPELSPGDLELEVLETSALVDLARVTGIIESCRQIGVMFALDDFGTGYSSLTYLKHLPVKLLKIDQSFVRDMLDDPDDLAILEGVLGLAIAFRRQVIAEGVETVEHGKMLLQLGCELAQGYGIARPMPAHDFPAWASAWRPDSDWSNRSSINRDDLPLLFASVEHRAWIVAFARYLKGEREDHLPLDHHQCRLGVWLDAEGQARYGAQSAFHVLESLHRQVHLLAADLCELKVTGYNLVAVARLGELHVLRDALLEQLQTLLQESLK
ncbi:MAG: EAL domain-containing protein [Propionivibrio sp.]|uniref:EAL domain-containing protein n=1 Tax=Propionivibrio sp. TaxID=2212460 RepID=UPI001A4E741A|nr:EAL domain-containing protein [Propionivibrio sp.]MBL8415985.1 EAL domain-containing protein [Propionivibrio sp.]